MRLSRGWCRAAGWVDKHPGLAGSTRPPLPAEVYHTTFDWPPQPEIQNRLLVPAGISEGETARKLLEFHRNIVRIAPSYPKILRVIPADQPCVDVFCQGKRRRALTLLVPASLSRAAMPVSRAQVCLGPRESGCNGPGPCTETRAGSLTFVIFRGLG